MDSTFPLPPTGPRRWALLLLAAVLAAPARAAFDDLGAGARAPGMGNAFTALADDVYSIHYNPAGLALLTRPELGTSYTRHLLGLTDDSSITSSFLGYAHPLKKAGSGTVGAAWESFSLNSGQYKEDAFYLSHARPLSEVENQGNLYGGVNVKYLRRSFGSFPESANAMNGISATGQADPVLAGKSSVGKPDLDLGFLYRLQQNYSVGLAFDHLAEPNVAFNASESDKLRRAIKLGLGYRSLLSNLVAQYDNRGSPAGGRDQRLTLAAERWFARLFVGDFGLRGSLGLGSREFKQFTIGISYRSARLGIDYGFSLPINTIASTAGSHRIGFSFRFGRRDEPDESLVMILDAMNKLKTGAIPELPVLGTGLSPAQKAVLRETIANAKALESQAQYQAALDKLSEAISMSPGDLELLKDFGRLNLVAQSIKQLPSYKTDPMQEALHGGILAFLAHADVLALQKVAYAQSLDPRHQALEGFLAQLELATGLKRSDLPPFLPGRYSIHELDIQASNALEAVRYPEAIEVSRKILREDENHMAAWETLGTAYFALGDYPNSLESWEKAFALEKSMTRRTALGGYIKSIRTLMDRPKVQAAAARQAAAPGEIQRLYNEGLDLYTAGQVEKSEKVFEKVLALDPGYAPAAKALRRVQTERAPR